MSNYKAILPGLLLFLVCGLVRAQGDQNRLGVINPLVGELCEPDPLALLITPETDAAEDEPIELEADTAESTFDFTTLQGDVVARQGDRHLEAEQVSFDRDTNTLIAEEGVTYGDPRLALRTERAELNLTDKVGVFGDSEYFLGERSAQGSAEQVVTNRETRRTRFRGVTYSTCKRGNEFWQVRARRIRTDEKSGRGSARDVTLAIRGVPVLYLPYMSFPITNERQSGFLIPRVGFDSDNGFDLQVPYYWNLAPNYDATFAPRIMTERGVMLGGEFRFLFPRHEGQIDLEYLYDDQSFGDDRGSVNIRHRSNFKPRLFTDLRVEAVTDDEYVEDFGNRIDLLSDTFLEQRFDVFYYGDNWTALARAQSFQTIEDDIFEDDEPYNRLPQFRFDGVWPARAYGLSYEMHGEAVYFERDTGVNGARLDMWPSVALPLESTWGFLTPRASYRYTTYALDNTEPGQSDSPDRGTPILSLDAGLFFERELEWREYDIIQTLEPRMFYLYVPSRDHDDIPLFDTTEVDRSFNWLFLENRFTSADRQGDANQLTTALTSRLLQAEDGREWFRFSVGQIQYFEDREVTLENTDPEQDSESEIIAEALLSLNSGFSVRGELQWDSGEDLTRRNILDVRYHPEDGRLINLSYRFARDDELEQVDASVLWPLLPKWQTFARFNYSLERSRTIEAFAGFEYNECCWSLRLMGRHHRNSPEDENADNSVALELELWGLGNVGSDVTNRLERAIIGFESDRIRY